VFQELDPEARFNFSGSDELAAQLREGADADVYAAASPTYPQQLFAEGLVERPRVFATNRLVLIVPAANEAGIESLGDLDRAGVKLVVGAEGVPIGDYTREVLDRAGASGVLDRVVSEEQDVKGVVGKVALGEADAGLVYATDARAAGSDVRAIELPTTAAVDIRYLIAIVRGGDRDVGEAFVDLVLSKRGRAALAAAGFGPQ
jgi:molybdate transport system substrate-binding protein